MSKVDFQKALTLIEKDLFSEEKPSIPIQIFQVLIDLSLAVILIIFAIILETVNLNYNIQRFIFHQLKEVFIEMTRQYYILSWERKQFLHMHLFYTL